MQLRPSYHVALESLSFSNARLSTVETAELKQQQQQWRRQFERFLIKAIRHMHISHNTPCLPPNILHNL